MYIILHLLCLVRKYKLVLLQKLSQAHMLDVMGFISWRDVGSCMHGVDGKVDLDDIDKDGEAYKRRILVNLWEERNRDDATYDALIKAMTKAGKMDEATKVCKLLEAC